MGHVEDVANLSNVSKRGQLEHAGSKQDPTVSCWAVNTVKRGKLNIVGVDREMNRN